MTTVQLSLEPLDSTDLGLCRAWRNQWEVWRWCRQTDLISDVEQVEWYRRQAADPSVRMYKVIATTADTTAPVGIAGFTSIRPVHRSAEFSLYIAPKVQRQGFGRRALALLIDHGFSNLAFNMIWGETFVDNPASSIFERLGMRKEGGLRQAYWKDGRFVDSFFYSITAEDWHDCRRLHGADFYRSKHDDIGADPGAGVESAADACSAARAGTAVHLAPALSRQKSSDARVGGDESASPVGGRH